MFTLCLLARTGFSSARLSLKSLGMNADELEGIYGCLPRTLNHFDLRRSQLDLQDELGKGRL